LENLAIASGPPGETDAATDVRDVVGVAGRDQIAVDHDGHVVAPYFSTIGRMARFE
jgi:hypothetical protein